MIYPLTSLRFFFAMMVFMHHLGFLFTDESGKINWWYQQVFAEGYIGVNFFFILSGFILAYNYQDKIRHGLTSKKDFIVARIARIYPLHLLTLILAIPLMLKKLWIGNKLFWGIKFLTNLTLTHSFIPVSSVYLAFNRPAWSISDEFFFYLLFPLLIGSIGKRLTTNFKSIYWMLLSLSIIPLLMLITPDSLHHALFYVNPVFRFADFFLGILLYNIFIKIQAQQTSWNFHLLESFSLLLLLLFFVAHAFIPAVFRYSVYYWLPMSAVILIFAFQKGVFSRVLSHPSIVFLGEISFGFYMFHHLILDYFQLANAQYFHLENGFVRFLLFFSLTLLVSYWSYYFFEKPANQWVKEKWRK